MTTIATTATSAAALPRRRHHFVLALVAIALVGFAARASFATFVVPNTSLPGDPRTYHLLGTNLADGLGYVRPLEVNRGTTDLLPTAEFPPGLPAIIAVATMLGARSPERQALLTAVLGAGTVVLIGLLGRRFGGAPVGLVAAALVAVHPLLVQPDAVLMSEGPYFFGVSAMLLSSIAIWEHPRPWWRWGLLGVLTGLSALVRPEGLLLGIALAVLLAVLRRREAPWRGIAATAIVVGVAALVVAPWAIRNAARFDAVVPVASNAGVVVLGANCQETYRGRDMGAWSFGCVAAFASWTPETSRIARGGPTEVEVYDTWRTAGVRFARAHWTRLPVVVPARVLRTLGLWNPSAQLDFDVPEGRNRAAQAAGFALHWVLLPFAIGGALWSWPRRRALTAILLVPVGVALVDTVAFYGSTKMRAVAEPSLAVLAATGLVGAFGALAAHRSGARRGADPSEPPGVPHAAISSTQ